MCLRWKGWRAMSDLPVYATFKFSRGCDHNTAAKNICALYYLFLVLFIGICPQQNIEMLEKKERKENKTENNVKLDSDFDYTGMT